MLDYPKYYEFGRCVYKIIDEKTCIFISCEQFLEGGYRSDNYNAKAIHTIITYGQEIASELFEIELQNHIKQISQ